MATPMAREKGAKTGANRIKMNTGARSVSSRAILELEDEAEQFLSRGSQRMKGEKKLN